MQEEDAPSTVRFGRFKTEEELLNYYEQKALDVDDSIDENFYFNNQVASAL
jgi:hypothetical protein